MDFPIKERGDSSMKSNYVFYNNGANFIRIVARLLGPDFSREEHASGVDFVEAKGRQPFLSLVDDAQALVVRFYVPVPDFHQCTREISVNDFKVWEYRGTRLEDVVALVEVALKNFYKSRRSGDE
jgi:hypothetical protein